VAVRKQCIKINLASLENELAEGKGDRKISSRAIKLSSIKLIA
jgi:hypothetical protein